jgi:hypothetical protein
VKPLLLGKAVIITYSEYVSVALLIQHAKSVRRIILSSCGLSGTTILLHIISQMHDFRKTVTEHQMRVLKHLFVGVLILRRIERYRQKYT